MSKVDPPKILLNGSYGPWVVMTPTPSELDIVISVNSSEISPEELEWILSYTKRHPERVKVYD